MPNSYRITKIPFVHSPKQEGRGSCEEHLGPPPPHLLLVRRPTWGNPHQVQVTTSRYAICLPSVIMSGNLPHTSLKLCTLFLLVQAFYRGESHLQQQ